MLSHGLTETTKSARFGRVARAVQAVALAFVVVLGIHAAQAGTKAAPSLSLADTKSRAPVTAAEMVELAVRYEHGEGVAQDYSQARELYCRAANLGNGEALLGLGWMYLNGRGVARDDAVAALWLHKASARGVSQATNLLQVLGEVKASSNANCMTQSLLAGPRLPPAPAHIRALVQNIARSLKVDPNFVIAVIAAESAFDALAVSRRGAKGLMQLMPETADRFGVRDPFNAKENIRGGSSYLHWLLDRFEGDLSRTLAAYNAGEAAVDYYGGVPPFPETVQYVQRVKQFYGASAR